MMRCPSLVHLRHRMCRQSQPLTVAALNNCVKVRNREKGWGSIAPQPFSNPPSRDQCPWKASASHQEPPSEAILASITKGLSCPPSLNAATHSRTG